MFYNLAEIGQSDEWQVLLRRFPLAEMQLRLWQQWLTSESLEEREGIFAKANALEELCGELARYNQ